MAITKAKIKVVGSSTVETTCLFNPADFSIQRSANYAEHKVPGLDRPILQFINGEAEVMRFSLFFDTFAAGDETGNTTLTDKSILVTEQKSDVREFTEPFYNMLTVDESTHAPPLVTFEWGSMSFTGYAIDVNQKFNLFSATGVPLRATLEITLKSNKTDNNIRNSPDRTKYRTVKSRDTLFSFAEAEYGSSAEWRRIAEANSIDNPRKLISGELIVIPAIT